MEETSKAAPAYTEVETEQFTYIAGQSSTTRNPSCLGNKHYHLLPLKGGGQKCKGVIHRREFLWLVKSQLKANALKIQKQGSWGNVTGAFNVYSLKSDKGDS